MEGYRVIVTGRVQGVFFRASTKEAAERLGIKGFVKNNADGSVATTFMRAPQEEQFLEWLQKGPPLAKVDGFEMETIVLEEAFVDFQIRY